jgi:hypothetical protein
MATLENIFHCDERNRWLYAEGNELISPVPIQIGYSQITREKTVLENLNHRHYIKIGEECIICCQPILHKANAVLTECGHYFHNSCVKKYYEMNFNQIGSCPLCRQDIGEGPNLQIYCNSHKVLDKLEDFWMHFDTLIPKKCYDLDIDEENHVHLLSLHNLGMNKNCSKCVNFRQGKYKIYYLDHVWEFE